MRPGNRLHGAGNRLHGAGNRLHGAGAHLVVVHTVLNADVADATEERGYLQPSHFGVRVHQVSHGAVPILVKLVYELVALALDEIPDAAVERIAAVEHNMISIDMMRDEFCVRCIPAQIRTAFVQTGRKFRIGSKT